MPHVRAGDRQHVCSAEQCQRERHRRSCAKWRADNAEEECAERVRQKVNEGGLSDPPQERLQWDAVRDAVGVEVAVVIEESVRHLVEWARDAVAAHPCGITNKCSGHGPGPPRDDIGAMARGP
jgi:hypothetical protein